MSSAPVTVHKSPADKREYRYLVLENGLRVVCISDPTSEKGAAALDMGVGQLSDPEELPGLAHFLEHLLFLGTEKYPDEETYAKTLAQRGGKSNAYTQFEDTVYFFDVASEALDEVLDIYAQFFIAPLFTPSATDRELNAVDSEHNKNLQQDAWRGMQLMRSTSDEGYPFSKFGTGSAETLERVPAEKGIDVRAELLAFHAKYYSAGIATLAVLGTGSLDELQATVTAKFGPMAAGITERPRHTADGSVDELNSRGLPFSDGGVGQWFSVVPVTDARTLALNFPIPPLAAHYATRPASLLGHLFGHESDGSILAALKSKGWATGLSAGRSGLASCDFDIFTVSIDLTDAGEEHVALVAATVFAYADVLRAAGAASLGWVHDELQRMGEVHFATQEPASPLSSVLQIAGDLQHVPAQHVLEHSTRFLGEYDPAPVAAILDVLVPTNVRVVHTSKAVAGVATLREQWYGTEYEQHALAVADVTATPAELGVSLALPAANVFVPDELGIKSLAGVEEPERYAPRVVLATPLLRLWHKQDNVFYTPKASVCVLVKTPVAYASPRAVVLTALAINVLKEELNTYAYFAEVAGLKFALAYSPQGLAIQVSGYDQKLPELLAAVVEKLAAPALDDVSVFAAQKDRMKRSYLNARKQQPYMEAFGGAKEALVQPEWTSEQKLAVIDGVSLDELRAHLGQVFAQFAIEALVHGNMTPDEAVRVVTHVAETLSAAYGSLPLEPERHPYRRVVALAATRAGSHESLVLEAKGPNDDDVNSALYALWQLDVTSPEVDARVGLLGQMLAQPAFNELRTKQQLGYIVDVGASDFEGVRGIRAVIQSTTAPHELDAALDAALADIRAELANMPAAEFEQHVAARKLAVSERDKRLAQETNRFWGEISKGYYVFDRVERELAVLNALEGIDEVLVWYDALMTPARKASSRVYAAEAWAARGVDQAPLDAVAFKRAAYLFPSTSLVHPPAADL